MLETKIFFVNDLPDDIPADLKESAESTRQYHELAWYLLVYHNGVVLEWHSDRMEPEDTRFFRDLDWVGPAIKRAYKLGLQEQEAKRNER